MTMQFVDTQFVREVDGNIRQDQRQDLADARLNAVQPAQKGLRAWQQAQEIQRICQVDLLAAMRLQESLASKGWGLEGGGMFMTWSTWAICIAVFGVVVVTVAYLGSDWVLGGEE